MTTERPVEVELKYVVGDAATTERLLAATSFGDFIARPPARVTDEVDRYFDSVDGKLASAGFAARLRQTSSGTVLTVKSTATRPGALQHREQLEAAARATLKARRWPASEPRSLILQLCGDSPLVELATIRQRRVRRELTADETLAELSLDEVDVVADGRVVDRFTELEIELRRGDERRLLELRALLDADAGLVPSSGSKLDRALDAAAAARATAGRTPSEEPDVPGELGTRPVAVDYGEADPLDEPFGSAVDTRELGRSAALETPLGEPTLEADFGAAAAVGLPAGREATPAVPPSTDSFVTAAKTPGVLADDTVAEAGRKVLRFHLARMIAREPGTRLGKEAEELHAMRVATRRMRAAWRVFGDGFRPPRTRRFRNRLRIVAGRLGAVRDRDVLIEALVAYQGTLPSHDRQAIQPLIDEWKEQRDDARELLLRELDSETYRRWVDDYKEFTRHEGMGVAPTTPTRPHRVRDSAASWIWLAYEGVRAYEPVLRWADVATLHDLRIAAKRLRYTLEFVRETLGPEAAQLIARVVALQDHLGLLNDADVAATLARSFLVQHAGELDEAQTTVIGRYLISREQEVTRLRRTVGGSWRGVAGLAFRRALGRVTAGL